MVEFDYFKKIRKSYYGEFAIIKKYEKVNIIMKITEYNSQTQLLFAYDKETARHSCFMDNGLTVSFRTYDNIGNTIELHIFYKK